MRNLLMLWLMLWGSASAAVLPWKVLTDTTKILYTDVPNAHGVTLAQGNTAGITSSVLTIASLISLGGTAIVASCTSYINLGMMAGSFILQIAYGNGNQGLSFTDLGDTLTARNDAQASEYALKTCNLSPQTNRQIVYVPEGKAVTVQQDITLTLKLDGNGYVVATIK